jgi:diguanylate cyclase (GGDEF)-like protein
VLLLGSTVDDHRSESTLMRILIVDDSPMERLLLRSSIEQFGHMCEEASDGDEAWDTLVVLTDWLMPKITGPELCQRIRARVDQPFTYVALCTGLSDRQHGLAGVRAGADTFLTKPIDPIALEMCLIAAERVTATHRELGRRNAELTFLNGTLSTQAHTDQLTGLSNRYQLHEDLKRLGQVVKSGDIGVSVILCDLDRFKLYNDRYGHLAGDEALRAVATSLTRTCRSGDSVYRFGGEELLVLLSHQAPQAALIAAERFRQAVEATDIVHADNEPFGVVTISLGIASLTASSDLDPAQLLELADRALYKAKHAGRNRVASYTTACSLPAVAPSGVVFPTARS